MPHACMHAFSACMHNYIIVYIYCKQVRPWLFYHAHIIYGCYVSFLLSHFNINRLFGQFLHDPCMHVLIHFQGHGMARSIVYRPWPLSYQYTMLKLWHRYSQSMKYMTTVILMILGMVAGMHSWYNRMFTLTVISSCNTRSGVSVPLCLTRPWKRF